MTCVVGGDIIDMIVHIVALYVIYVSLLFSESLYEDEEFDQHQRQLAALLVSKVNMAFLFRFLLDTDCLFLFTFFTSYKLFCFPFIDNQLPTFNSQVFYYLGELNDSLSYALGAGSLFDVSEDSDYIHTLLGKNNHYLHQL